MLTVEKIREWIIQKLLPVPELGVNYVDWHTENSGECGVTVTIAGRQFGIIIRAK